MGGAEVKRMRKWIPGVLMLAMLAGCEQAEEQEFQEEEVVQIPETENTEPEIPEYDTDLSEQLYDFQFALNGETWELPSKLSQWKEKGWEGSDKLETTELAGDSYTTESEVLKREEDAIAVYLVNPESETKPLKDCYVGKAELDFREGGQTIQLPGKITMGKSVLNQVLEAYGTPKDQYEEKEKLYLTYEYGMYKQAEFVFDVENEILNRAVLTNFREPEEENDTISQEIPEEVEQYEAPETFSEDPLAFVVSYDHAFYKIPAPVECFLENGWSINETGSDSSVKAGRHGYVTLEKDGQSLYAVVKNYGDQRVPARNCMVTNVSGDFDVTKVPIAVGRGITLGMGEDQVKILLGGSTYEEKEEENGISYYLYADETQKNYIRIFLDQDLKLVREIEATNSPEQLLEQTGTEEEPQNINSSVLVEE